MNNRFKEIREKLGFSQEKFGEIIGLSKSGISNIESGQRNVTDKHIKLLSSELNINPDWLRTGEGEMFNESDEFSLDEYAQQHDMSEMDLKIIKGFLDLDPEVRKIVVSTFSNALSGDRAETKEKANKVVEMIDENKGRTAAKSYRLKYTSTPTEEMMAAEDKTEYPADSIDAELESYRRELEAERQNETSSVSPESGENIG